jgi:phosphatidate cytidylyltransferase
MMAQTVTVGYIAGTLGVGGVGVWASGRRELIRRWCTWAICAPVVVGCLWFGAPGAALLAAGLAATAAAEYGRLARLPLADRIALGTVVVALPLAAWLTPGVLWRLIMAGALVAALVPVLTGDAEHGGRRAASGVFGVLWLASLSALVLLGGAALPLCFAVAAADVGAWCGGRLLGGPSLSKLSPAKRWGGVGGAAIVGLSALAATGALTPPLAIAVVAGAPLGDLLESMLKRGAGVKDAGKWLPGFGGLLDRVDSLLLALALAVIL